MELNFHCRTEVMWMNIDMRKISFFKDKLQIDVPVRLLQNLICYVNFKLVISVSNVRSVLFVF